MKWIWRIAWSLIALVGVMLAIYFSYATRSPGGDDWGPFLLFFMFALPVAALGFVAFIVISITSIASNYKKSRKPFIAAWAVVFLFVGNGIYLSWWMKQDFEKLRSGTAENFSSFSPEPINVQHELPLVVYGGYRDRYDHNMSGLQYASEISKIITIACAPPNKNNQIICQHSKAYKLENKSPCYSKLDRLNGHGVHLRISRRLWDGTCFLITSWSGFEYPAYELRIDAQTEIENSSRPRMRTYQFSYIEKNGDQIVRHEIARHQYIRKSHAFINRNEKDEAAGEVITETEFVRRIFGTPEEKMKRWVAFAELTSLEDRRHFYELAYDIASKDKSGCCGGLVFHKVDELAEAISSE